MKPGLYCPRCGSDRLARLAKNDITPFRGYRCGGCGRRLRDRGSLAVYLVVLAVGLFFAAAVVINLDRPGVGPALGRAAVLGLLSLACVGYAAVELSRPTPRTARPAAPAADWYFARNGAKVGPFAFDRMRQMAASGALSPADMVLDPTSGVWASAGTIAGLFGPAPADPARPNPDGDEARPAATPPPGRHGRRAAVGVAAVTAAGLALFLQVRGGGAGNEWPAQAPAGVPEPRGPETPAAAPAPAAVERLTVGPGREILHTAGLGPDAERLGRALGEAGYSEANWPGRVRLDRRGDTWVVELGLKPAAFDDPKTPAAVERWVGVRVAALAFPGGRVEVRLCEAGGRERAAFRVEGAGRSPIGQSASAVYSLGGAKAEGDKLADLLARGGFDTRVGWVILLAREPGGWVITPLNLRPEELVPGVRRKWAGLARSATAVLAAPARVEVLGDDYRPAASLTAADETEPPGSRVPPGGEFTLRGHTARVWSIDFSPDGRWLASGSDDRTVRLWDAVTGAEGPVLKGHGGGVTAVRFTPDGRRLVSGSYDKTVRVWDVAAGKEVLVIRGDAFGFVSVSVGPDGRRLAAVTVDGFGKIWDASAGGPVAAVADGTGGLTHAAFDPSGTRVATTSSKENAVRLWDAGTGRAVRAFDGPPRPLTRVCFSPDGRQLAAACRDETVRVWDVAAGRERFALKGPFQTPAAVCYDPEGARLAAAGVYYNPFDRVIHSEVKVWDATTGRELVTLAAPSEEVTDLCFSPDGKRLAKAAGDGTVQVWDASAVRLPARGPNPAGPGDR